jgi:hypothetical protein
VCARFDGRCSVLVVAVTLSLLTSSQNHGDSAVPANTKFIESRLTEHVGSVRPSRSAIGNQDFGIRTNMSRKSGFDPDELSFVNEAEEGRASSTATHLSIRIDFEQVEHSDSDSDRVETRQPSTDKLIQKSPPSFISDDGDNQTLGST